MTYAFDSLVGRWVGEGTGEYPAIEPFSYRETLEVAALPGRPLATWRSITADAVTGEARHAEVGFLRATDGGIELVLAHGFGVTEIATAAAPDSGSFRFESTTLGLAPSAKQIDAVVRTLSVAEDVLAYDLAMAAVGISMTHHLDARLIRQRT